MKHIMSRLCSAFFILAIIDVNDITRYCWSTHLRGILTVSSFQTPKIHHVRLRQRPPLSSLSHLSVSESDTEAEVMDDQELLRTITRAQLEELCQSMQVSIEGTKAELLQRLRDYAKEHAQREYQQRLDRKKRIEEGTDSDSKERYEILSDILPTTEDEEDSPIFYFPMPASMLPKNETKAKVVKAATTGRISSGQITAPPAPLVPNEQGERTVTVYSTSDQNDLTGVALAQPGATAHTVDSLANVASSSVPSGSQPWDVQQMSRGKVSKEQEEKARGIIIELVSTLLAMTGLPAFVDLKEDDDDVNPFVSTPGDMSGVGFVPSKVPEQILTASSQALRTGRGQVLQDVLREFELQGIGYDGKAADNIESGGGHYQEVSKVRAFLEGYRRAEVRRIARETTTLLLDKLVSEGIEGLDVCLAGMVRSSDDTGDFGGELNDSLLDYLNDAVRQQQKKVDQQVNVRRNVGELLEEDDNDAVNNLWQVSTDSEDGHRVESFNPNDPKAKQVLTQEYSRTLSSSRPHIELPDSVAEKLLLLLTTLRERIKAESVFGVDEKGRNLRLLAYCLRVAPDERPNLIMRNVGGSLDRLDSFIELVQSSVEYGESTSHQLQPSKKQPLNVSQLKSILNVAQQMKASKNLKAGGVELRP